jgi:hypothetical protein
MSRIYRPKILGAFFHRHTFIIETKNRGGALLACGFPPPRARVPAPPCIHRIPPRLFSSSLSHRARASLFAHRCGVSLKPSGCLTPVRCIVRDYHRSKWGSSKPPWCTVAQLDITDLYFSTSIMLKLVPALALRHPFLSPRRLMSGIHCFVHARALAWLSADCSSRYHRSRLCPCHHASRGAHPPHFKMMSTCCTESY